MLRKFVYLFETTENIDRQTDIGHGDGQRLTILRSNLYRRERRYIHYCGVVILRCGRVFVPFHAKGVWPISLAFSLAPKLRSASYWQFAPA